MTDTVDVNAMVQATDLLMDAMRIGDVHTVTLTINGQHGGVDLRFEGIKHMFMPPEDFVQEHILR